MEIILNFIHQIDFIGLVWIFLLAVVLHEMEEWNILRWYEQNYIDMPPTTDQSVHVWIGLVILIGLIWGTAVTIPGNPRIAAFIFLPAVFLMLQNALQHVYWQFYFKHYAPGVITAVCCLFPLGIYLITQAVAQYAVPLWYPGMLFLVMIPGLVQTVRAKNRMTKQIRAIHHLSLKLTALLQI